jgi:hypothetical protein
MALMKSSPSTEALRQAWRALSLELPRFHRELSAGRRDAFEAALGRLPDLESSALSTWEDGAAIESGLDVLMVEAMARRHRVPRVGTGLDRSAQAVSERLGLQPILSYPLYIRENPSDLAEIRRFTDLDAEFRFIRMHAAIEDIFDDLILRLDEILDAPDPRASLRDHFPALSAGLRSANRIMSGFRSPVRMPRADFFDGFRPYYNALYDDESGELILEGPSGLQSFTYRLIAMQMGYQDRVLDGWTQRIGLYHPPAVRQRLDRQVAERDAGRSLNGRVCEAILGVAARPLPHLHPAYGAHMPSLVALAQRGGYLAADVLGLLDGVGLKLGEWPAEMPSEKAVEPFVTLAAPSDQNLADLSLLAELEAALVAMHLEHAATAAHQIGADRGTGGTSGVEFLLVATFRRAFPALWQSDLVQRITQAG